MITGIFYDKHRRLSQTNDKTTAALGELTVFGEKQNIIYYSTT